MQPPLPPLPPLQPRRLCDGCQSANQCEYLVRRGQIEASGNSEPLKQKQLEEARTRAFKRGCPNLPRG